MSDHPSDSEPADLEEYPLAKTEHAPLERKLPYEVRRAMEKADEAMEEPPLPEVRRFQFTIRDMLILTTVVAFLMGIISSIARGLQVTFLYLIFFAMVLIAWVVMSLWKSGYWRKRTSASDEPLFDESENPPDGESAGNPLPYSVADLILMIAGFAFVISLCSLLPGQRKLGYVAGISGFFCLVGLVWYAASEDRQPILLLLWGLMFLMYLLTSLSAMVMQ